MNELEKAIEELKSEGYSSDQIQTSLKSIIEEPMKGPTFTDIESVNDYLDSLVDDQDEFKGRKIIKVKRF